jgi:protein phosphatase
VTKEPGLQIGHRSDPGRQRKLNEDSYLILTPPTLAPGIQALLAVADGMGGHRAGEVASQTLVEALDNLFSSSAYQQYVAYNPQHADYYVVVLKEVLERINEQICDLSAGRSELSGLGTTATVAILAGGRLFWGHVGDSRAYLLRNGNLQRLTRDHTWVAQQIEAGQMTTGEAARHPRRNVLTQSLGNSLLVRVERGVQAVQAGDLLLLCSDGLSSVATDTEIQEALLAATDPQVACDRLVALANQRGGPDNITVLAAQLVSEVPGSDIVDGRVLGPVQRRPSPRLLADTLKLKRARRRRTGTAGRLARGLGVALVLLLGALLSGLGALFAGLIPPLTKSPVPMVAILAVVTFAFGALLGWLMWPAQRGRAHDARDKEVAE